MDGTPLIAAPEICPGCHSVDIETSVVHWRCRRCQEGVGERPRRELRLEAIQAKKAADVRAHNDAVIEKEFTPPDDFDVHNTGNELVGYLQSYHLEHGRTPTLKEWDARRPAGAPGSKSYRSRFGSWNAAMEAAGLVPNEIVSFAPRVAAPAPAIEVDPNEIVTARWIVRGESQISTYVQPPSLPDWREDLRRRYVTTLIEYVEATSPWEYEGSTEPIDVFYGKLCNRVERLLEMPKREAGAS